MPYRLIFLCIFAKNRPVMVPAISSSFTAEEYLAFERASQHRHEFIYNTLIEMAGATLEHNRIVKNLFLLVGNYLRSSKSEVLGSDMRVFNPQNGSYFYPDIVISDGEAKTIENDNLINPILVIEVASPSTAVFDKTDKFIAYRSIETLKEYVLISTELPQMEVFRKNDKGEWSVETVHGLDKTAQFQSVDISVLLKDVFEKVF
ncbi:hypothetical protein DR864_22615 [Runella rosea]|uniref:Putative restriction endonuclease domain-containing protein n=2 Tax=Runella rosea TaxID=2259595 RepID=A0A344TNW5_9BACT|nr:hypothetical protein DR864_22615 [Runella rosea]